MICTVSINLNLSVCIEIWVLFIDFLFKTYNIMKILVALTTHFINIRKFKDSNYEFTNYEFKEAKRIAYWYRDETISLHWFDTSSPSKSQQFREGAKYLYLI